MHTKQDSEPVIKDFPSRAALMSSRDDLIRQHTQIQRHESYAMRIRAQKRSEASNELYGRAPTIVSSVASPTGSRRSSIKRRKRFMLNKREMHNKFFYPVNGPKRHYSRRGKYRTSLELDASMNYVNIDVSMSKDLCVNQYVGAYSVTDRELLKLDPELKEEVKAITVDSKNNIILYTPVPTIGQSSITDAEQILNDELLKLGSPVTLTAVSPLINKTPDGKTHRLFTYPPDHSHRLLRTNSLPVRPHNERLEAVWNLYLRRVIAERIKWRLTHMHSDSSTDDQRFSQRFSVVSSVETNFFINHVLHHDEEIPPPLEPQHTGDSKESFISTRGSPRRQAMFESLEQLMHDVESMISNGLADA